MPVSRILFIVAVGLALVAAACDFGWFGIDSGNAIGYLALSVAALAGAALVDR